MEWAGRANGREGERNGAVMSILIVGEVAYLREGDHFKNTREFDHVFLNLCSRVYISSEEDEKVTVDCSNGVTV